MIRCGPKADHPLAALERFIRNSRRIGFFTQYPHSLLFSQPLSPQSIHQDSKGARRAA